MARFVFRLEGILRQRRWEQQQAQRELAERQARVTAMEQELRDMNVQVRTANQDMRDNRLHGRLDLSFLTAHRRFLAAMQRGAVEVVQRLAQAQRQVAEAQAVLAEASVRYKAIEKLRERQFERWRAEQDRIEMIRLDEVGMQLSYQNLMEPATERGT